MKPVAIFRFSEAEGPGYFATFLDKRSIPWKLIAVDQDRSVPEDADGFSGLCLMGGPMSVNDDQPWIGDICALVRDADAKGIAVIGHCLGGQLISKAFGGDITRNPVKEIGWGAATASDSTLARRWLGDAREITVFQWHGETFSLPENAQHLLASEFCANQMFVLGKHLGMQCHVEMTETMITEWCKSWDAEVTGLATLPASVQTPDQILIETPDRLPLMRQTADRLYAAWIDGLKT